MKKIKKVGKVVLICLSVFVVVAFVISFIPPLRAEASSWLDEATDFATNYSEHPVFNYSLDFYVENEGGSVWKPWTWGESIGNSAMYAIYMITNVLWLVGVCVSWLAGYIMEEAYNLDFISKAIGVISGNIQKLAGVNQNGFMNTGLFAKSAGWLVLIMGVYLLYVGLFKREFTKGVGQTVKFIVLFVAGMGFIAYSSNYITQINDFSVDMNDEVMDIGATLTQNPVQKQSGDLQVGESEQSNSIQFTDEPIVNMRQTLFDIQVRKPYLLLQYGESDEAEVTKARINKILEHDPYSTKEVDDKVPAEEREKAVKEEVLDEDNTNMSLSMVGLRLGMVFLTLFVNIVITACIFIFSGVLIFSQVLFIIFIYFLPVAIVFGLLPGRGSVMFTGFSKAFNAIMTKTAVTILLTVVFSISSMIYSLSEDTNYFWMSFLQIVVFVVSVIKMNDFFGFMHLSSKESKDMTSSASRVGRNAVGTMAGYLGLRSLSRKGGKGLLNQVANAGTGGGQSATTVPMGGMSTKVSNKARKTKANNRPKMTLEDAGAMYAKAKNAPKAVKRQAQRAKDGVKDLPINAQVTAKKMREGMSNSMQASKRRVQQARDNFAVGAMVQDFKNTQQAKKQMAQRKVRREQNKHYLNEEKRETPQRPAVRDMRNTAKMTPQEQHRNRRRLKENRFATGVNRKGREDE